MFESQALLDKFSIKVLNDDFQNNIAGLFDLNLLIKTRIDINNFIDKYNKNPNLRNLLDVSERIDKRGEWQSQIPFRNIIYTKNNENIINFEHIS